MEQKKHQMLIELESWLNRFMVDMTNQSYSRNFKMSYKYRWEKGQHMVDDGYGGTTRNYYSLTLYCIDKNESPVGHEIILMTNYYPINPASTVYKTQELAYKELLFNGLQSLVNITYSTYLQKKKEEIVKAEDIKIDAKIEALKQSAERPKLFIP